MENFDKIIHQPVRLQIMSALSTLDSGDKVDFSSLKKLLELTDGNLGAHLLKLEEAGYIQVEKTFQNRIPKTYISLTPEGRCAFDRHVQSLEKIIGDLNVEASS